MDSADSKILADPFAQIFSDWAEADWAFDFLQETVKHLGLTGPYDTRFALTLTERAGNPRLHLTFGHWLIVGFSGPGSSDHRVDLTLLADRVAWDQRLTPFSFSRKEGEPEVRTYQLPLEIIKPLTRDLQAAFEATLAFIADKFRHWKRPPSWKQHQPEIIQALFDTEARSRLFAGALTDTDLRYERHRTSFYQDVSEEEAVYEVDKEMALDLDDDSQPDYYQRRSSMSSEEATGLEDDSSPTPPYPLSQMAGETGFAEETLARWVQAIQRKGQAILYGPPGTGKTYLAEKLAQHLVAGGDGFVDLVQFHPAYAYEDFIQGLRPQSRADGSLSYPLLPGRFLQFSRRAEDCRDICVLIIDEINRADLARVFGELMYLLEYRDRQIPLAGGGMLRIPANVRLIGTMNTADRSIALVDHALRRRFAFLAFYPNYEILRHYHRREQTGFPLEGLIDTLTRLNRQINDPHYAVGVTFFLRKDLAEQLEAIWRMEIEPYLEEYFFDQPEKVDLFRWEVVREKITPEQN